MPFFRGSLAVVLLLVAAGLRAQPEPAATVHPEIWPKVAPAIHRDAKLEKRIDSLLRKMTLEEKVGQVIQASITAVTPADVKTYHLGSVLNGGGGWPGDVRKAAPRDWLAMADAFHDASMDRSGGGTPIPIIWGLDAVHGHNNIVGATLFPHNVGLGATHDPDLIRRIGEVTAEEMTVTGADWNFSPTVAVARDRRWGRSYESYSEDPALVETYAEKMIEGLQGKPGTSGFLARGKVAATSKHFLGDGGTTGGRDQGDTNASEAALRDIHAAGYRGALRAGVQAVMASYSSWQGVKMHGNRALLTDVLKGRLGFDGIVVGDWNGHGQVPGCTNGNCAAAFNAGVDMFMVPEEWKALYTNTLAQVKSGQISRARLDDAVRRILRVKMRAGLFTAGKPSQRPGGGDVAKLGSPAHREVARQAVRESLVLLKNDNAVLPIHPQRNVMVAGDGADNIAKQTGGWTLTWQGDGNSNADFPGATSIWSGIRQTVEAAGGHATLSADGNFEIKPDVAIVVFGENPYAEFRGDLATMAYDNANDLQLLRRLKEAGIPVVSLFLSGRPLWVNPYLNASDAFVAAWLPGTEGNGVADVLFTAADGSVRRDFQGRLAFSWPKLPAQGVLNRGESGYDPLFALGYGLEYADRVTVPKLSEDTGGLTAARTGVYFSGESVPPWQLFIDDAANLPTRVAAAGTSSRRTVTVELLRRSGASDARIVTWSGEGRGDVYLAAEQPADLTREANGEMALSFEVSMRKKPTHPVTLGVRCGPRCGSDVDVTPLIRDLPINEWGHIAVRLRCFAGADLRRIDTPFRLSTDGELAMAVGEVKLAASDASAKCPQ